MTEQTNKLTEITCSVRRHLFYSCSFTACENVIEVLKAYNKPVYKMQKQESYIKARTPWSPEKDQKEVSPQPRNSANPVIASCSSSKA